MEGEGNNLAIVQKTGGDIGFSWNLTLDGKMDVDGHNVNLHDAIDLQFGSLLDIKQKIIGELFGNLDLESFNKERLAQLVYGTSKQIKKNMDFDDDLKRMEEELLKFRKKHPEIEIAFLRKIKELKKSLIKAQGDLDAEKRSLEIYKMWIIKTVEKLKNLFAEAEKQGDSKKQEKYLKKYNMLLGDKFIGKIDSDDEVGLDGDSEDDWKFLLSLPEDRAPRINLNIEGTSYEIRKGDKYKDKDWRGKIKEAIRSKNNDEDFVNFVLNFILRPFKVGEKYDEETIKYYVYSIIECIENDGREILQRILELYKKREKLLGELGELQNSLSLDSLSVIQNYSSIGKTGGFSLEDISRFKQGIFCELLEKKLRDENLEDGDKEVVENLLKNLNDSGKLGQFNFDIFVDDWSNGEIKIEKFEDKDKFVKCFSKILGFLGIEPGDLSIIYERINDDILGREFKYSREDYLNLIEEIVKREKSPEEKIILEKWNNNLGKKYTSKKIGKLKAIFKDDRNITSLNDSDIQLLRYFQNFLRDVIKIQSFDVKKRESEIRKIFGLGDENITNDGSLKGIVVDQIKNFNKPGINDKNLVMKILKALVEKINEGKAGKGELIQGVLEEINYSEMGDTLKNLLDNIDVKIRQWLYEEYGSEERNNEELEDIVGVLGDIRHNLNDCCSLDDYKNIENKIEDVKKKIESNEYIVKVQRANQYLYQFENWENCNISELHEPLKWLIVLKRFFVCEDFTLMEKFEYSEFIFDCIKNTGQKKSQKIYSKKPEHDRILISLFGEENVIKKNKEESGNEEGINIGRTLHPLEEKILNEFGVLLGETNAIYDKKGKKFDFCTKFCEILFKEEKQKEEEKERQKQKEEEIKKMYDIFGEDLLRIYIQKCIDKKSIDFGDHLYAINGKTGEFNFSVVQAGILREAVEKGKIKEVLEYLGFYIDPKLDISEQCNNSNLINAVKGIVEYLYQRKSGCFCVGDGDRNRLDISGCTLVNIKINSNKFSLGKENDKFRLAGLNSRGIYVIMKLFENDNHKSNGEYYTYLGGKVKDDEKEQFFEISGHYWDTDHERKSKKKSKK